MSTPGFQSKRSSKKYLQEKRHRKAEDTKAEKFIQGGMVQWESKSKIDNISGKIVIYIPETTSIFRNKRQLKIAAFLTEHYLR